MEELAQYSARRARAQCPWFYSTQSPPQQYQQAHRRVPVTGLAVLPRHAGLPAPRSLCRDLRVLRCSSNSLVLLLLLLVSGKGLVVLLLLQQAGPGILKGGTLPGQLVLVGSHGLALLLDILLHRSAYRALLIGALLVVLQQVP
jgi:hypothetical protein